MRATLAFAAIALPWLNPFTFGPTPAVLPWLFSTICLLLLLLVSVVDMQRLVPISTSAWLLAAVISAALGLLQYFGATEWLGVWANGTRLGEAFGNLRQRNQYATLTSIGLLVTLWFATYSAIKKEATHAYGISVAVGFSLVLLALGNAASGSRTGLMQWIFIVLLTFWWQRRGMEKIVSSFSAPPLTLLALLALAVYGVGLFLLPLELKLLTQVDSAGLMGRLDENVGCSSRLVLWSNVLHLIAQKPWFGWGWGELDYAHFITLYPEGSARFCEILDNAHNLPLHLAVELGIPLAFFACGTLMWLVAKAKPWQERDPTRQLAWGILAVIGLHSLLEYPLWYGPFQMAVLLCVVILIGIPETTRKAAVQTGIALGTMVIGAVLALALWDYWRISQMYMPVENRDPAYQEDTINRVRTTWFFKGQHQFAEFTTTPLTPDNAVLIHDLAKELLHFSPEPRVVDAVIRSAHILGKNDEAAYYQARYQAAYPTYSTPTDTTDTPTDTPHHEPR
ncbi:MAG: hypothetical protein RIR79_1170 [Pseudomonadota bacterium]|jgi:O-antigen ligase